MNLVEIMIDDLTSLGLGVHEHLNFDDSRGNLSVKFEAMVPLVPVSELSFKKSESKPNVGRGLHYQISPCEQEKFISVTKGAILDFVYDTKSPTETLYFFKFDETVGKTVHIPPNFAHGFITLERTSFEYIVLGKYSPTHERTLNVLPNASKLLGLGAIDVSTKDRAYPPINVAY